jgi:hypothetical protein
MRIQNIFYTSVSVQIVAFSPSLSISLLCVSAGIYQRDLVDETEIIKSQMGTHNRSENDRSALNALYTTIP